MIICGIEIKSNEAIFVLCEVKECEIEVCDNKFKKIELKGNEQALYKNFYEAISSFVKQNKVERIYLKKPIDKGRQPSGANAFRIETIINMLDVLVVAFHVNTIASFYKKNELTVTNEKILNKYQTGALETAYYGVIKELKSE